MEKRQITTVMNIDDFIDEHSRQGTINDINDLYEDSYKELYLKKCADYEDLMQQFQYELMVNEDLHQIVKGYQLLVKDSHIIDEMNEFIKIRQKRISRVIEREKRRNEKSNGKI